MRNSYKYITILVLGFISLANGRIKKLNNEENNINSEDQLHWESLDHDDNLEKHQNSSQIFHLNSTDTQRRLRVGTKSYNILALGGSVTWGSQLSDRNKAFPNVIASLGPHKVRNRALRATGSFFPAVCLQSMLRGDDTIYDVILLEFTINGVRAFDWLVKRLRARYPNAIIIYVHLYSLRYSITDALGKSPYDHGIYGDFISHREHKWYFKPPDQRQKVPPQVRDIPKEWNMYSYYLPYPKYPIQAVDWFASDWHHLSDAGHAKIAREILDMLTAIDMDNPTETKPVLGTWGLGDTCYNWFGTGETDLMYIKGEMRPLQRFGVFQGKYTMEFYGGQTGGVMISNPRQRAPMWIHFMSTGRIYPNAKVHVWDHEYIVDHDANSAIIGEKVETKQIGWAEVADNFVTISPEFGFEEPFRLVAIGFCGACYEDVIGKPKQVKVNPKPPNIKEPPKPNETKALPIPKENPQK